MATKEYLESQHFDVTVGGIVYDVTVGMGSGGGGLAGVYDVTDYGATGDGTTDDTAAIQAALDACAAAGGGRVYFANSTFLADTITPGSNTELCGRGTLKLRTVDVKQIDVESGVEDVVVQGLRFDGNFTTLGAGDLTINSSILANGNGVTARDCRFFNLCGAAMTSTGGSHGKLVDCVVEDFRDHVLYISTSATDFEAENVESQNDVNSRGAYKVRNGGSNYRLRGCKHTGGGRFLTLHSSSTGGPSNIVVEGCYAELDYNAILFEALDSGGSVITDVKVTDCTFVNTAATPYSCLSFNWSTGYGAASDVAFSGCAFTGNWTGNIGLAATAAMPLERISFSDCRFDGDGGTAPINLANANEISFSRCRMDNDYGRQVWLQEGLDNIEFSKCTFLDENAAATSCFYLDEDALDSGVVTVRDCYIGQDRVVLQAGSPSGATSGRLVLIGNTEGGVTLASSYSTFPVVYNGSATATADDTSPSVLGLTALFLPANVGATAIGALDDGVPGQQVTLVTTSATNTPSIADGGNFKLSAAWSPNADDTLTLVSTDGSTWVEISRSSN